MKSLILLLLLTLTTSLSCGKKDAKNDGLTVEVSSQGIIIPDSEILDCNGNEVKKDRFAFQKTKITWAQTDRDLTILFVKIEFHDENVAGGVYSKVLGDEDLDNLFQYAVTTNGGTGNVIVQNGSVPAAADDKTPTEITNRDTCRLNFGGVVINDKSINFSATATITVQGIATGNGTNDDVPAGDEIPVRGSGKTKVVFNLN